MEQQTNAPYATIDPAFAPGFEPTPQAEPAAKKFRLVRSRTDKMLGGVCGGIAQTFGIDATMVRIGLVALSLLGVGTGVVLYVAIWALAPEADIPA